MAKKDGIITENADRNNEDTKTLPDQQKNEPVKKIDEEKTEVKNASASGLGSIGRSEEE